MIQTFSIRSGELVDAAASQEEHEEAGARALRLPGRFHLLRQLLRFSLVGGLNTLVDLLLLNILLWRFPTTSAPLLLAYNALAYSAGAVNSFVWNKYWTFQQQRRPTRQEIWRFAVTTLLAMGLNCAILWLASLAFHEILSNATIWANVSKIFAIGGTMLISYVGMRLWVFASRTHREQPQQATCAEDFTSSAAQSMRFVDVENGQQRPEIESQDQAMPCHSLSIVLPAYNEEQVIASTITTVLDVVQGWLPDFEVLVVDDGSTDRTGAILAELAASHPQLRVITHTVNQGYGAALASGFQMASKELTFFMDSDGQFDIRALQPFFAFIDEYDAVFGYRIERQDTWVRKSNAWGWHLLIRSLLGVRVRDIDCAFKLFHTTFLHAYAPETRGATINAELLYKFRRAGYTYREIGVPHLPRQGGRATGAHPLVILRAFRDLFIYTRRWRRQFIQQKGVLERQHV